MAVCGTTGVGKTYWVYRLLYESKATYAENPPETILYCYGAWQDFFEKMENDIPNITFHEGLPSKELLQEVSANKKHNIIVLDDLAHEVVKNPVIEAAFTKGCHHSGYSLIYITQNMYQQGKSAKTISLNTWYKIIFKNTQDASQINTLGRQMYPGKSGVLRDAYDHATDRQFGYLVIDNSPHSESKYRLRTRIFKGEDPIVYVARV